MKAVRAIILTTGEVLLTRTRVRICPEHAFGDLSHPDCRNGAVSSFVNGQVFVRFDDEVQERGWDFAQGVPVDVWTITVLDREEKKRFWERVKEWI